VRTWTCVSNRDTDPPIQNLLHAVGMLCINYYEAFQRKKRANSWNDCHSRIECLDSKSVIKNLLGFRACNFQHASLASGQAVLSSCGADPSKAKTRLSSPSTEEEQEGTKEQGARSKEQGYLQGYRYRIQDIEIGDDTRPAPAPALSRHPVIGGYLYI
jgi:hypothetical protein